jgi:hypothetical protein
MLEAIKAAIASAITLDEVEAIQAQIEELAEAISKLQDEAQERYEELEAEAEEAQAAIDAAEEAAYEAEELARTGEKVGELKVTTDRGEAIISKHRKTYEVTLLHHFYGQCEYYELPATTPETDVISKAEFNLNEWPFEIRGYCGWYGDTKVEVSPEEILLKGIEAARQEKLNLLFQNN